MSAFKFKVAYTTEPEKIEPALINGLIDEGDLIIINKNGSGSMRFVTDQKQILDMSAEITEAEKQEIVNEVLVEADERYLPVDGVTLILNGNSSLQGG